MAGLLAARALAGSYGEVTLVDRDELPAGAGDRRGVPQGRQLHALLAGGQQALERLFPGLTDELVAGGVPVGDALADVHLAFSGARLRRAPTGLVLLSLSRPLLEHHVRARVLADPSVVLAPPADVVGLAATPDGRRVTGARVVPRGSREEEVLDADLVVDATGRGSRLPAWLVALDHERPAEERVAVDIGYGSCRFRLPDDALGGALGSVHAPTRARPRGAALARLEGGQWVLTLAGTAGDHPPTDLDGFVRFARAIGATEITAALQAGPALGAPVAFRFPASVRRRYEHIKDGPVGLVVVGDSVCSFNPVYGQGMTVAALEALALREHVRRAVPVDTRRLQRQVGRCVDPAWQLALTADLDQPGVGGRRRPGTRLMTGYVRRLHAAAANDADLATAFVRVSGLVDPPAALLRPRTVLRVLRHRPGERGA